MSRGENWALVTAYVLFTCLLGFRGRTAIATLCALVPRLCIVYVKV
jgi:hypothetical protein